MAQASFSTNQEKLEKALICMESALQLLDEADAPADIGAHLDLAISRLKQVLPQSSASDHTNRMPALMRRQKKGSALR